MPRTVRLKDGRDCLIRQTLVDDAAALLDYLPKTHAESDFLLYMPGEFQFTLEQEREFLENQRSVPNTFLVMARIGDKIAGLAGAHGSKFKRYAHHAEFGVMVSKEFWGLGLGRELTRTIVEWSHHHGLRKLNLHVYEDNHRGIALYRSMGFVEEGRLRGQIQRTDGTYADAIYMTRFFVSD